MYVSSVTSPVILFFIRRQTSPYGILLNYVTNLDNKCFQAFFFYLIDNFMTFVVIRKLFIYGFILA